MRQWGNSGSPKAGRGNYNGVLAPNAPWRAQVTATAGDASQPSNLGPGAASEKDTGPPPEEHALANAQRSSPSPCAYLWAILLARLYEVFPLRCPQCGTEMRFIAFVTDTHSGSRLLVLLGQATPPPAWAPARGPPGLAEGFDQSPRCDPAAPEPVPVFDTDQIHW